MLSYRLGDAATLLGAALSDLAGADAAPAQLAGRRFYGVATDSRKPLSGALFVALAGPNFDGHDYVAAAAAAGAGAALVARRVDAPLPQLRVDEPLRALGQLAAAWRRQFRGRVLALTGSNGKTTTKTLLAAILAEAGATLATAGNLNNEIGVPLTLARLADQDYAVIEMGANHANEIAYLTGLAQPDVALITNAGPAHLEGFGDLAGVACAKGEIFQGLGADGVAVLNADDAFADYWRSLLADRRTIDFALDRPAAVCGEYEAGRGVVYISLGTDGETIPVRLALPGRHNAANALAAAAAARAVGAAPEQIRRGLESVRPVAGRLQTLPGRRGSELIDDSYNANPASLAAALRVLGERAAARGGEAWLALGDMAELGGDGRALHRAAGEQARAYGVRRLYALGKLSRHAVAAFGDGARGFDDAGALADAIAADLDRAAVGPPCVLVKGSRSMRMERIVRALSAAPARAAGAPIAGGEG